MVVNGKVYYVMDKIGKGGSSQVFQVLEAKGSAMLALKKVDMSDVSEIGKSNLQFKISPLDGNHLKWMNFEVFLGQELSLQMLSVGLERKKNIILESTLIISYKQRL